MPLTNNLVDPKYDIYDLGFAESLVIEDDFYTEVPKVQSNIFGINPANIGSGEFVSVFEMTDEEYRSSNFVTGVSGWRLGPTSAEFVDVTVSGVFTAGEIHVPDVDTTANSFHVNTAGDTWWGATETDFNSAPANAAAYVLKTGVVKFNSGQVANFYLGANDIWGGNAAIGNAATTIIVGNLNGVSKIALGVSADAITIAGTQEGVIMSGSGNFRAGNATDYIKFTTASGLSWKGTTNSLTEAGLFTTTNAVMGGFYVGANDFWGGNATIGNAATTVVFGNLDGTSKLALGVSADAITIDGTEEGFIVDGTGEFRGGNSTDFVMFRAGEEEGFSFKGTNAELTEGGLLDVSNIDADGGIVGGFYLAETTLSDNIVTTSSDILLDSANRLIRVGDTGDNYLRMAVVYDGTLDEDVPLIESSNYVSGPAGSGFHIEPSYGEFGDLRARGKFTTLVMEYEAVSAVGGSLLLSKSSDVLDADMTALDASTMTISGSNLQNWAAGDMLQMKDGVEEEWFEVVSLADNVITATRDKEGEYDADANPVWKKGTAVVNYGASGDGGILLTASSTDSPRIDIFTHGGSPWSTLTPRLRIGNINNYFTDINDDVYGLAVGDNSDFLRCFHDGSNLQFKLSLTGTYSLAEIELGTGGYMRSGQESFNDTDNDGFWMGEEGGESKVSIGDGTQGLKYAGGEMEYTGAITAAYPIQLKSYTFANLPISITSETKSPTANA